MRTLAALSIFELCNAQSVFEGPVKAATDRIQCGQGSWCQCDSVNPTCHESQTPCQCFANELEASAILQGSALIRGAESPEKLASDVRQCGYGSYCKCDSVEPTCQYTNAPCNCGRRLQREGKVKASSDELQCGFGSYCKCDSVSPTCYVTNTPCQCFGTDDWSTAAVASAVERSEAGSEDVLTLATENMLDRIRINEALRSQIMTIEATPAPRIRIRFRTRLGRRIQALYDAQLQRAALLGEIADTVNSYDLIRAIKDSELKPSVVELVAFKEKVRSSLESLTTSVFLRDNIFKDIVHMAWSVALSDAVAPIPQSEMSENAARLQKVADAIETLSRANEKRQVLKNQMQELVQAFQELEEAEGVLYQQPEESQEQYEHGNPARRLFGLGWARTAFVGYPYGAFATHPTYATMGFASPGVVRCYGGFCSRYLW